MIKVQYNGKDLDDLLQKAKVNTYKGELNLPAPTPNFNFSWNGTSLATRYAGYENKAWQRKLPRSFLNNGVEVNACLKGTYPVDNSFHSMGAGTYEITRTNTQLKVGSTTFTTASNSNFDGAIPYAIGIAICAGGGKGANGGGNGGGGGGGGAMGMYILDFNKADKFKVVIGGASADSSIVATKGSSEIDKVVLQKGGNASGRNGGAKGTVTTSPKSVAIYPVHGTAQSGAGGYDANNGEASSWNWYWGTSSACMRSGKGAMGSKGGAGGAGGGASFGKGGNGGDPAKVGTNGSGGGGGNWGLFNGKRGANGGSGIAWLYY